MIFRRNNRRQSVMHTLTLILALCPALLLGCSDKEEILPPESEEGTNIRSEYNAYVGHPFNAYLGEKINGYTVKNNDPEKLETKYFGIEQFGVVLIFPLCEGESSIDILDKDNKLVTIIKIQATMWGSKDVEVENAALPYGKPEVQVEAQDIQTKRNIEKELTQEQKERCGTHYTFDKQTRLFTMTFPDGRKGYEGTYHCGADSLIMQTESMTKKYGYKVGPGDRYLIIREDRTEEFRQRYPDAGVTSVTTQENWRDHSILDIFLYP